MPPAFNLSQDQTLEFNACVNLLLVGVRKIKIVQNDFNLCVGLGFSPSAYAYRLYLVKEHLLSHTHSARLVRFASFRVCVSSREANYTPYPFTRQHPLRKIFTASQPNDAKWLIRKVSGSERFLAEFGEKCGGGVEDRGSVD